MLYEEARLRDKIRCYFVLKIIRGIFIKFWMRRKTEKGADKFLITILKIWINFCFYFKEKKNPRMF